MKAAKRILPSLLLILLLTGCSPQERIRSFASLPGRFRDFLHSGSHVIITTGLTENELFRVGDIVCTPAEYRVYLINMQKLCEAGFTDALWEGEEGRALAASVKDNALARISRIKTMVLIANEQEITLTESEERRAADAAAAWYENLSEADLAAMGSPDPETVRHLVTEWVLADKVYQYIIRDIDPEISDDEARRVTVGQIVLRLKKGDNDSVGSPDEERIRELNRRASQIRAEWEAGADFGELAARYNEAERSELTFGRGEVDPELEEVAFALGNGEVSEPFLTDAGVTLLYMKNVNDPAETDANKKRIIYERRREVFGEKYDAFAAELPRTMDDNLYKQISLSSDPDVTVSDFFRICEEACTEP